MESNQDTVDSKTPIIYTLKTNHKQKKVWGPNQLGVKKVSENYDLCLAKDYSQICAAIGIGGDTANFLKDTGVNIDKIAEV